MKHRFEVLDVFRGIFSSMVVFYHMSNFSDTPILNNNFVYNSDLFVDFFFVLSGFVITYSYQEIKSGSEMNIFLKKRFLRLYPLHIIMLVLFLLMEVGKHFLAGRVQINNSVDNSWITFLTSFFLLNSVRFPGVHDVSWNIASWSISAEMISYIVFALTGLIISVFSLKNLKYLVYLLMAITALIVLRGITGSGKISYAFDYGFLRGLIGFFSGAFCFGVFEKIYPKFKSASVSLFSVLEVFILAFTIYFIWNGEVFRERGFVFEILFFIAILIFAFQKGYISGLLNKSGFLNRTGKYSYSIYMVHTLFISLFNVFFIRILKLPPSSYSYIFILNYAVVYVVSAWTYKNIEMRFNYKKAKQTQAKI